MSNLWKSVDDRQLEQLQKINELLYTIHNHQKKISTAQVTEMAVIISLLGKMVNKLENLEKRSIKVEDDV